MAQRCPCASHTSSRSFSLMAARFGFSSFSITLPTAAHSDAPRYSSPKCAQNSAIASACAGSRAMTMRPALSCTTSFRRSRLCVTDTLAMCPCACKDSRVRARSSLWKNPGSISPRHGRHSLHAGLLSSFAVGKTCRGIAFTALTTMFWKGAAVVYNSM